MNFNEGYALISVLYGTLNPMEVHGPEKPAMAMTDPGCRTGAAG
jgi:hypothetical protein